MGRGGERKPYYKNKLFHFVILNDFDFIFLLFQHYIFYIFASIMKNLFVFRYIYIYINYSFTSKLIFLKFMN